MGRGAPSRAAWRWLREHAVNIVAALVVVYLLIPIAVIFVFSFNDPRAATTTTGSASPSTTGHTPSAARNSTKRC